MQVVCTLSADLTDLGGRIVEINAQSSSSLPIVAGTTYRFRFGGAITNGKTVGILYFRGTSGSQHLSLFVNGYGYGTARLQVFELTKGSDISYEVDSEYFAIKVTPNSISGGNNCIMGYFTVAGTTPTIETV